MGRGLSHLQQAILETLPSGKGFQGGYVGWLPTTGDILTALGKGRTNANYAAVSKALRRLEERGMVVSFTATLAIRGNGFRYARQAVG